MISAIVHTYNEEENIERCLASLGFVDEVVVVDMGSTDKTLSIAEEFHAKIFHHPYTGFVEPARNFAIEKATGDWIFILDADEEVPKNLSKRILAVVSGNKYDYVRIPRMNIIWGKWIKHTGWWPDYQIRLFRKGNVEWVDTIHGVPFTKGVGSDLEASEKVSIIHYNYLSLDQYLSRMNRYTTVVAKEMYMGNKRFSLKDLFDFPTQEFIRRFFVWEGYKDGLHGLALSLLQSFSELVTYLKLWELEGLKDHKYTVSEVHSLFTKEYKEKDYWFVTELLKEPNTWEKKLSLKLKRRLKI
ncbi:glycosyltransferase family 2 protein [Candidatus Gottesmanbacteria bacterium]|nr:glycosyltransferase family 2 protein [Candidatus Gottesmanbacteria bacterium]